MLYIENNIKIQEPHLQSLSKVFLIFKISIWYDNIIVHEDFPDGVGIMCINSVYTIGSSLDIQIIENFITTFVTNIVFRNVGLSWIIHLNKNEVLIFNTTFLIGSLIDHVITL